MQQFKAVWRRLPESAQDYWREQFLSARTQAEKIQQIRIESFGDAALPASPDEPDDNPPAENEDADQDGQDDGESEKACVTPDSNSDLEARAEGPASSPEGPRSNRASQPRHPIRYKPSRRENGP